MDDIGVINPKNGEVHYIPYQDLGRAMQAGGQFADEKQKQKAIQYQINTKSTIEPTPFNNSEQSQSNEPPQEQPGFLKTIGIDALRSLSESLRNGVGYLTRIPGNIKGIGEEYKKDPLGEHLHAFGQEAVGIAEGLKGIANMALQPLRDPLMEDLTGGKVKLQIPETTGLQHALGLDSNKKGDELIKDIPDIASLVYGGSGLIKKGFQKLGEAPPLSKEKKLQNAISEDIIKSEKEYKTKKKELNQLKVNLAEKYAENPEHKGSEIIGALTPSGQRIESRIKKNEIEALTPTANIPEIAIGEPPLKPDTESLMAQTKEAKSRANESLSEALKAHENIPKKAGEIIKKHATALRDSASKIYNKVEKAYKGKEVPADNTAEINDTAKKLDTLIQEDLASGESIAPGYGSGTSEQKALEAKINSLKSEKVQASDVYDMQRTLQNRAQKARDASFAKGIDKSERTRLTKLAQQHERLSQKLGRVLENVGDPDTKALLKTANEGWKAYSDISRTKVGKYINRNEGFIPADTLGKIEGTGPGNALLKDLAKKEPELARLLFGQKYGKASQHEKIFERSNVTEDYLKMMPQEVRDKVADLSIAMKRAAEKRLPSGETVGDVKSKYKDLAEAFKKNKIEQESRVKAKQQIDQKSSQIKHHDEANIKLENKIKEMDAKGENTDKLKEDLARRKREYSTEKTQIDKLKANLMKVIGAKISYEAFFKDKH